ncbi:AAA family ATPase [Nonomuraea polychroma]|uniref:AAA family ATPase n=1 Tax=Nonomuraea polychroma TaxID=46176 RepID=UPI003D94CFBA
MLTICLYGLAGSGKSTAAAEMMNVLAERGHKVEIIKLAAPLYELQGEVYRTAGREIGTWEHDNELLRSLATQLRRINPMFLVENFLDRTSRSSANIVINDDMRDVDPDYHAMRAAGFSFVRVTCSDELRVQRMRARADRTIVADSDATWGYDRITPDWEIGTDPHRLDLRTQVEVIADKWLGRGTTM